MTVVLPIKFGECTITNVEKPVIKSVEYEYGSKAIVIQYDGFSSKEGDSCNYKWKYTTKLEDGSDLPKELIKFDSDNLTFTIDASSGIAQTLKVQLKGTLSNGETRDSIEFDVKFTLKEKPYYFVSTEVIPGFVSDVEDNRLAEWRVSPGKRLYY